MSFILDIEFSTAELYGDVTWILYDCNIYNVAVVETIEFRENLSFFKSNCRAFVEDPIPSFKLINQVLSCVWWYIT